MGNHTETCVFFVTTLAADNPIILGLPWLQRHNPTINWRSMSMTFQSPYCLQYCCTAPCTATTVPCPTKEPHDIAIPGEPRMRRYQATVEDEPPDERTPSPATPDQGIELVIDQTLTPGRDHYITRRTTTGGKLETRAKMIPNRGTPRPTTKTAGSRRVTRAPTALPPLSAPIPRQPNPEHQPLQDRRPDMTDIRTTTATTFLQFCKSPGTQCMRVTWDELDAAALEPKPKRLQLPDLPEEEFRRILTGHNTLETTYNQFPATFHDFLDTCHNRISLNRLSDTDIEKFMKGKPDLTADEIKAKLPDWLQDKLVGFLPRLANELPPRRAWDHKIELIQDKSRHTRRTGPLPQES